MWSCGLATATGIQWKTKDREVRGSQPFVGVTGSAKATSTVKFGWYWNSHAQIWLAWMIFNQVARLAWMELSCSKLQNFTHNLYLTYPNVTAVDLKSTFSADRKTANDFSKLHADVSDFSGLNQVTWLELMNVDRLAHLADYGKQHELALLYMKTVFHSFP